MPPFVSALIAPLGSLLRSHRSWTFQVLALQYQVAVHQQTVHRSRRRPSYRVFWARLCRLWPGWQEALAFVQPRTLIVWQRKWFRKDWQHMNQLGKLVSPRFPGGA